MPKLRITWYYTKHDRRINAYNVHISKSQVATAGFDITTPLKIEAEKGKIIITRDEEQ